MWSRERRGRAINAFQRNEILALAAADAKTAELASKRPHYSGIGDWLSPGLGGRVLELGCGPGRYVALLGSLGFEVIGVDPVSFPLWDEIKIHRNVNFLSGVKAEFLPFPDNHFDHVACISALLYFNDSKAALSEIKRVIKPGGRLCVRTVSSRNLSRRLRKINIDPVARNYLDEAELTHFLRGGGFDVHKTFTYGFFPPILTEFWWYLCNGTISINSQEKLSALTPADMRVSAIAFADLPRK